MQEQRRERPYSWNEHASLFSLGARLIAVGTPLPSPSHISLRSRNEPAVHLRLPAPRLGHRGRPKTPEPALARIAALGAGYTCCVARAGVIGADRAMELDHHALFDTLRRHDAALPILGFGISTPGHVRTPLAAGAAGVISGSAIVKLVEGDDLAAVRSFVGDMKAATLRAAPQ